VYERSHVAPQRIVERADDKHDPFGLLADGRTESSPLNIEWKFLWFGPVFDIRPSFLHISDTGIDFKAISNS
jgi:hypothetical protein